MLFISNIAIFPGPAVMLWSC